MESIKQTHKLSKIYVVSFIKDYLEQSIRFKILIYSINMEYSTLYRINNCNPDILKAALLYIVVVFFTTNYMS